MTPQLGDTWGRTLLVRTLAPVVLAAMWGGIYLAFNHHPFLAAPLIAVLPLWIVAYGLSVRRGLRGSAPYPASYQGYKLRQEYSRGREAEAVERLRLKEERRLAKRGPRKSGEWKP